MLCPKGRVGSNPTSGTDKKDGDLTVLFGGAGCLPPAVVGDSDVAGLP